MQGQWQGRHKRNARNISQIFAASPTSTNARQDSVSYASAERKQPALATTKEAKNWPSSCFAFSPYKIIQIVNVQKEANASHLFKSQGFRFFRFLHPLRFLCWRFPRPLHHGNKIWKRAGDINGRGLDLLAPQWDEMPKQTHVSAWHPSLCVIQSQTWGTPYISHVVHQMFRWFHIPSHDVQTTANLNPTRLCFKTRWSAGAPLKASDAQVSRIDRKQEMDGNGHCTCTFQQFCQLCLAWNLDQP